MANISVRRVRPEDAAEAGPILYKAFEAIFSHHRFPVPFPSPEEATLIAKSMVENPGFYSIVAELEGKIVGSNFMDERSPIRGVGPISVDPAAWDTGAGRELMQAVLDRAAEQGAAGIRLQQDSFHNRSFVLYTKLGFRARVSTAILQGPRIAAKIADREVRPAREEDLDACNRLCLTVHGHDRGGELADAVNLGRASIVERDGRVTGYTSGVEFLGHSVGEANEDLMALIAAAEAFAGPGFHVPTSNDDLIRWCCDHGLRMVNAMTLMSVGLYHDPQGAYLPSVGY
jgi:predicted N-acetyltransferase YhbS